MGTATKIDLRLNIVACAALACLAGTPARADITTSGAVYTFPGNGVFGPGNTDVGSVGMFVGNSTFGSMTVNNGALLSGGLLTIGSSELGNGNGQVLLDGPGSRITLVSDGFSDGLLNRLEVGAWGRGVLTVSSGAFLDGRANAAACLGVNHYCNNFIGGAAGSDGSFTITGAGSQAAFLRGFFVGGVSVFAPPIDTFSLGTPGGSTQGRVNVLNGGTLTTDSATLGLAPNGASALGTERSFADVVIRGAGSVWAVTGPTLEAGGSFFVTAEHRNAWATLDISQGGRLRIEGRSGFTNAVNLTGNGGRTDALVTGANSRIEFTGESGVLQVGRALGSATLDVRDGAEVRGMGYVSVGRDGSFGTLAIDGAGSRFLVDGTLSAAANGVATVATMDIGRNGTGVVNVSNGGVLELRATTAAGAGPQLSLGRGAGAAGTLSIGSGASVLVNAASVLAGGGPGEAFNPFVRIGRDGAGTLDITGGGQLLVQGNAVSTPADTRRTSVFIGGAGDVVAGGRGIAAVDGVNSLLRVAGSDAYVGVGHGPLASGQLTMTNQAKLESTILGVGNFGATGVLRLDNAQVNLSGQYTGAGGFGASLVVGAGSNAVGVVQASNGALIRIENPGAGGTGVTIGGSGTQTGGSGSVTLVNSRIEVVTPAGQGGFSVGRTGSGLLRLQQGSSVDVAGNNFFVGRESGSDGVVIATGGSSITAGWVGVGRNLAAGSDVDGGTGTLVLNGATLTAQKVVIGTNGYLGGSAGSITAGEVVNYGTFSPGSSPGRFSIDGDFAAAAGSRLILEVGLDSGGQLLNDEVIFAAGKTLDFANTAIEFRFLGAVDPRTFANARGFALDTFLGQLAPDGQRVGLDDTLFSGVNFSARSDSYRFDTFSFNAAGGAAFTVTAVPEPASWALGLAGGLLLLARRRLSRA